jgi:thioredoxin-like negative regulator of GroEL
MAGPDSTWEKLKQKLGHKVKFEEVNCDEKPEMATQFGVKGFPTILKLKKDKVDEFGGERSLEGLEGFVNSD